MQNNWRQKLKEVNDEIITYIKEALSENGNLELITTEDYNERDGEFYELPRVNVEDRSGDLKEYSIISLNLVDSNLTFKLYSTDGTADIDEKDVTTSYLDISNLADIADYIEYLTNS